MLAVNWTDAPVTRLCPLCDQHETYVVSRTMQHELNLTTVICKRCALVFTNPLPNEDVYNRFYTEAYSTYYGKISHSSADIGANSTYAESILDAIEAVRPLKNARVLEIGSGRGFFLHWARQRGADVLGLEPSREFYDFLLQSGLPALNTTLESLTDAGTFDTIAMFHVLEHFYDPNLALQRCHALLNDGGHLAIIVPDITAPYRSLDHYFLRYVHPTSFSAATLGSLLNKHGFKVVRQMTQGNQWYEPHNVFIIAQRQATLPDGLDLPTQSAAEVVVGLRGYRFYWRFFQGPRWHGWQMSRKTRRFARRSLDFVKRRLIKRTLS